MFVYAFLFFVCINYNSFQTVRKISDKKMASNPLLSLTTPFSKKFNKSYRIPKLPKKIEAAVIQPEKTNFEEIFPNSDEIVQITNKKKITDYEIQKFLADIDLKLEKVYQLNSNPQSKCNTKHHKSKINSHETGVPF